MDSQAGDPIRRSTGGVKLRAEGRVPALDQKLYQHADVRPMEERALRVSAVTGLSTLISIVLQIVSVPICLRYWGTERYGSWLALYAAFMLLRAVDTGFVSYVSNQLNVAFHQSREALQDHLASSLLGVLALGSLQLLVTAAALLSPSVIGWLGLGDSGGARQEAGIALLVLVATWVLSGPYLGIVHRLMVPTGMMYQAAWWSMAFQAGQFGAVILAAVLGFGLLHTSLLFSFLQITVYVASAAYIARRLPEFFPWWGGGRLRTAVSDLRRSSLLTAGSLVQQGATSGLVILVSSVSGPAAVPVFTTARTLANLWMNVTNVLTAPLLPDVVRYHAKGEGEKLVGVSAAYWAVVGTTVNLGVVLTYPGMKKLYTYWTDHALPLDAALLSLLTGAIVVWNAGGLISLYLSGINRVVVLLKASLARALTAVLLGWQLFLLMGPLGLGVAIILGESVALGILAIAFYGRELPAMGIRPRLSSAAPIAVSTLFVLAFLSLDVLGLSYSPHAHVAAVLGVLVSTWWGWHNLADDSRVRIVSLTRIGRWRRPA